MPTVQLVDASRWVGRMSDAMLAGARRGLRKAAERGVQKIVVEIIPSRSPSPVDRGVYKAGWKTQVIDEDTVSIMNPETHAIFIEEGVRPENVKPGFAMRKALYEWVLRKGIASNEQEAISITWAIAMKMKKTGIFRLKGGKGAAIKGGRGLRVLAELKQLYLNDLLKGEIVREVNRAIGVVR